MGIIANQKGVTLIEAMVAMVLLSIGIVAVAAMQTRAIGASGAAFERTGANGVALSVLETLKALPFDDANLVATPSLNNVGARTYTAAGLPELQTVLDVPAGAAAGTVVDNSGLMYQLSWAVQDTILPTGENPCKTVRVFMTWASPFGQNRLVMTSVKYRNITL
ncbi:MAG: prepilin-type N-terminal cleavage/methylation domain-containing protein [Desulfurivibrionaceae bacterium]|nr:prepilin-type N-terminal cleavage/methylation domain-containing protein [Desulfurivibrionaceae bacterium]